MLRKRFYDVFFSGDTQSGAIECFKSTSRYLDDLLNIDNPNFEGMISQIYPVALQLNKANTSDTIASLLDLHLSILDGDVHLKSMTNAMIMISTLLIFHFKR